MTINQRRNFIINIIYFALIAGIVYIFIKHVLILVMPFIIGFAVALVLKPVINFASDKFHLPHKAAAVLLVLLSYAGISSLVAWAGMRFVALVTYVPEIYNDGGVIPKERNSSFCFFVTSPMTFPT